MSRRERKQALEDARKSFITQSLHLLSCIEELLTANELLGKFIRL